LNIKVKFVLRGHLLLRILLTMSGSDTCHEEVRSRLVKVFCERPQINWFKLVIHTYTHTYIYIYIYIYIQGDFCKVTDVNICQIWGHIKKLFIPNCLVERGTSYDINDFFIGDVAKVKSRSTEFFKMEIYIFYSIFL